jgi:hypothetical protein
LIQAIRFEPRQIGCWPIAGASLDVLAKANANVRSGNKAITVPHMRTPNPVQIQFTRGLMKTWSVID